MQRRASVLIADDHPLVSHGLRELLRSTYTVVGTVGDGREVHDAVERLKPDVLLLDLSMPHRNGLDLIPELVAAFPTLRILVVTMHVDRTMADLALQGGAEDLADSESSWDIVTDPQDFKAVEAALRGAGVQASSAEISMVPTTSIPLAGGEARHVLQLIDALEELDDVQNVYANFDIPEEVMASL